MNGGIPDALAVGVGYLPGDQAARNAPMAARRFMGTTKLEELT